jgi:hypothetical protein
MSRYAKAVVACLSAAATWGITAGADGTYSQVELWGGLGALAAVLLTYVTPNDPPKGEPADPNVSERGESAVVLVVGILAAVVLVLLIARLV